MAMDYDWLWVILAVGVFATIVIVPIALVRDAYSRGREYWRERSQRSARSA
jgi:hypothetical protein